jgi:hypothetical protein
MSGWLTAAHDLFRRRAGAPTPFEIQCVCGKVVEGQRSAVAQTINCPACGAPLFVLPASVYPVPKAPKRKVFVAPKAAKRTRRQPIYKPRAEEYSPTPASEPSPGGPEAEGPIAPTPKPGPVEREAAPQPPPAPSRDRLRRRLFSPVRIVLAGVAVVVSLTVWWALRHAARDQAERTIVSAAKLGEQALSEHDLGEAARQFQKVHDALDLLGRTDPHARALRQTARETTAAAELAKTSLFDILHEAANTASSESWSATFRSNYRDEWVVLDALVARSTDPSSTQRYEIRFPIAQGKSHAVVVGDLTAFDKTLSRGGEPERVIFAAQLDDCIRDPHSENGWRIVLRSGTGFLWSSASNLEILGMTIDDGTKSVLVAQCGYLGVAQ